MTQWIADNIVTILIVGAGVVGAWFTFGARLASVEKDQEIRRGQHKEHYEATRKLGESIASMDQKLTSHIADDQRQIDDVKGLLKENRDLTIQILTHLRNGGK